MELKFITGNKHKFKETANILKPIKVKQVKLDLDEIQDVSPRNVIKHKLVEAFKHHKGPFIIEDSSLNFESMGGKLPGPFIRWFLVFLGPSKLANIAIKTKEAKAEAEVIFAYAKHLKHIKFFSTKIKGKIVKPRGNYGFGYDPIFMPDGENKTYAQLKRSNNFKKSARWQALMKLKKYLKNEKEIC